MKLKIYFSNGLKSVTIESELKTLLDYLNSNQFVSFKGRIYNTSLVTMICEDRESKKVKKDLLGKIWQPPQ